MNTRDESLQPAQQCKAKKKKKKTSLKLEEIIVRAKTHDREEIKNGFYQFYKKETKKIGKLAHMFLFFTLFHFSPGCIFSLWAQTYQNSLLPIYRLEP